MSKWDDLFNRPEEAPSTTGPRLSVVTTAAPGTATSYAAAALRRECEEVASTPNGSRNDRLNLAWYSMGRHIGAGNIDVDTVRSALADAGRSCGLPQHEIDLVLRDDSTSAMRKGASKPRHPEPLPDLPTPTVLDAPDLTTAEADEFWASRTHLEVIHTFAQARRVSPWATLGVVLARVATATPYFVALPPIVGGIASLNLFVGLVGPSGAGKGAAESVAAECLDLGKPIEIHTTGSGEGIAHGFRKRTKDGPEWLDDEHAVLFSVPEIDTLSALGNRQGATLMPELRRGWSGERLGFAYADPSKRLPVPAHEYRMCLVAGIQPTRAQALLEDADGGTPQRFLWLPASDPRAPEVPPECPSPLKWKQPDTRPTSTFRAPDGKIRMTVCQVARTTIDQARLDRLRGVGDALDGHGLLTRLKVAAALALLDGGRLEVTDEDWDLSGVVLRKSDATRAGVQHTLKAANEQRNEARATAEAKRSLIVTEQVEDAAIKRVSRSVMRKLRKEADWTSHSEVRRAIRANLRGHLDEALERLAEAGQIEADEVAQGVRYRVVREKS